MNKHESCIYYLFKECFDNEEWLAKATYNTLLGVRNMLIKVLEKIDKRMESYR